MITLNVKDYSLQCTIEKYAGIPYSFFDIIDAPNHLLEDKVE